MKTIKIGNDVAEVRYHEDLAILIMDMFIECIAINGVNPSLEQLNDLSKLVITDILQPRILKKDELEPFISINELKEFCRVVYPVPDDVIDTFVKSIKSRRKV